MPNRLSVFLCTPRCRTSPYRRTFMPHLVSLWNDLDDNKFDHVGLSGCKSRGGGRLIGLIGYIHCHPGLQCRFSKIIIITIN